MSKFIESTEHSIGTTFIRVGDVTIGNQLCFQSFVGNTPPVDHVQLSTASGRVHLHNDTLLSGIFPYHLISDFKLCHYFFSNIQFFVFKYISYILSAKLYFICAVFLLRQIFFQIILDFFAERLSKPLWFQNFYLWEK